MIELKVLGTGCAKCTRLAENAEAAAQALGLDYRLDKVTDRDAITDAGVLVTPALQIGDRVAVSGKVPTVDQIKAMLG